MEADLLKLRIKREPTPVKPRPKVMRWLAITRGEAAGLKDGDTIRVKGRL